MLVPKSNNYKKDAWKNYTIAELAHWVKLLKIRASHRVNEVKQQKDLHDASIYEVMLLEKLKDHKMCVRCKNYFIEEGDPSVGIDASDGCEELEKLDGGDDPLNIEEYLNVEYNVRIKAHKEEDYPPPCPFHDCPLFIMDIDNDRGEPIDIYQGVHY